ncbi:MAG: ABC-F family ATP-binding cassette domain-containing protein [Lachnospiraceae bacterium]|nr:ABC-F family ATP-binding cassette domain-containing protein [Lachnospiraceae bacterium]
MLYQISNGVVSVGGQTILSRIDLEIKEKEKIAIVGRNGVGKTTLLRLISGELELDRDDKRQGNQIISSRKVTIGMLRQTCSFTQDETVEELLLGSCPEKDSFSKERFDYEMEYDRIFTGFGFTKEDKKRRLFSFSGGEQTKISLIQLLLMKPDILLLDEPTNHLDIQTTQWLEAYMRDYENAVVFVSHDRFFLDQVVNVVYEIQNGVMKRYSGNYTNYREQKLKNLAQQQKAYQKQQTELEHMNELIEKFKHKPKKAAFARSRKSMMARMNLVEKPQPDDVYIFTGAIEPQILGGKWVYEAEHLKIGYDKPLLELSLRIKRGQKIGIIGDNGVGKSTFLKTVAGLLAKKAGAGNLGQHILMGYFDQNSAALESEKQVVEHFHDLFPSMTEKEVRQTLGAYLFTGKDASKRVSDLSGGEKSRLVLAELLTSRPNFLILDEPTNHMDIQAKETLESAFRAYTGTILFVSHDRYFINQVADSILLFEDHAAMYYPFGYEHYVSKSRQMQSENPAAMMRAEEQAMIADFKAVPKKETGRLRTIGTEEAYLDWKLGLTAETMAAEEARVEELWNQKLEAELSMLADIETEARVIKIAAELEQATEKWTEKCLEWLDIWETTYYGRRQESQTEIGQAGQADEKSKSCPADIV